MGLELDLQTIQFITHKFSGKLLNSRNAIQRELKSHPNSKYLNIALRDIESINNELIKIKNELEIKK